jgi:hypothetical protein
MIFKMNQTIQLWNKGGESLPAARTTPPSMHTLVSYCSVVTISPEQIGSDDGVGTHPLTDLMSCRITHQVALSENREGPCPAEAWRRHLHLSRHARARAGAGMCGGGDRRAR